MKNQITRNAVVQDEIDLLVDGELPEERRGGLFEHLEADPAGWKRCALGFLEAQMWRESMEAAPPAAELRPARRRFTTPLAALAAAVAGFAVAFLALPRADSRTVQGPPLSPPPPEVRYVPYPVVESTGLVPASDESGQVYYTTRDGFPEFVLRALEEAGHDVRHVERFVDLPREDGESLSLPISETRIVESLQL